MYAYFGLQYMYDTLLSAFKTDIKIFLRNYGNMIFSDNLANLPTNSNHPDTIFSTNFIF